MRGQVVRNVLIVSLILAAGIGSAAAQGAGPPDGAKRMNLHQSRAHGTTLAAHAVKAGDSHGGGSSVNLSESDRS